MDSKPRKRCAKSTVSGPGRFNVQAGRKMFPELGAPWHTKCHSHSRTSYRQPDLKGDVGPGHQAAVTRGTGRDQDRAGTEAFTESDSSQYRSPPRNDLQGGEPQRRTSRLWSAGGHRRTEEARRPKRTKLAANPRLCARVVADLERLWSPEQIAARLREEFGDDHSMRGLTLRLLRQRACDRAPTALGRIA